MSRADTSQYAPSGQGSNILREINSSQDISNFLYRLLGLYYQEDRDGGRVIRTIVRNNKPLFTDEFVYELGTILQLNLNYTIQFSTFDGKGIEQAVGRVIEALNELFHLQGDDNYVSNLTWQKIVEIHEKKKPNQSSGWEDLGIKWKYDSPVTYEMINRSNIRDNSEENDQTVQFATLIFSLRNIIKASLRKSFSDQRDILGMLPKAIGEIRTESQIIRDKEKKNAIFGNKNEQEGDWAR